MVCLSRGNTPPLNGSRKWIELFGIATYVLELLDNQELGIMAKRVLFLVFWCVFFFLFSNCRTVWVALRLSFVPSLSIELIALDADID